MDMKKNEINIKIKKRNVLKIKIHTFSQQYTNEIFPSVL